MADCRAAAFEVNGGLAENKTIFAINDGTDSVGKRLDSSATGARCVGEISVGTPDGGDFCSRCGNRITSGSNDFTIGVEIDQEATEVLVLAICANDGDGSVAFISRQVGVGACGGISRQKISRVIGIDRSRSAGYDDVHPVELGGEAFFILDLLELGCEDDLIASIVLEIIDNWLQVCGEGIEVVGAWTRECGALRSSDSHRARRGNVGQVWRRDSKNADFLGSALDDC